jgi:hypothetical protein
LLELLIQLTKYRTVVPSFNLCGNEGSAELHQIVAVKKENDLVNA